jgi:hypothetical protein
MRPLGSRDDIVQQPVEPDPLEVRVGATRGEAGLLEPRSKVPANAPARDSQVPPPIGDAELAEVDITDHPAPVDEDVRRAVVAVTDYEVLRIRARPRQLRNRGPVVLLTWCRGF